MRIYFKISNGIMAEKVREPLPSLKHHENELSEKQKSPIRHGRRTGSPDNTRSSVNNREKNI